MGFKAGTSFLLGTFQDEDLSWECLIFIFFLHLQKIIASAHICTEKMLLTRQLKPHQFQFNNLKEMNFSELKLEIKSTH